MTIQKALKILDLDADATQEQIRQAYTDLAQVWHPDKHPDNPRLNQKAERKIKEINGAFETLQAYSAQSTADSGNGDADAGDYFDESDWRPETESSEPRSPSPSDSTEHKPVESSPVTPFIRFLLYGCGALVGVTCIFLCIKYRTLFLFLVVTCIFIASATFFSWFFRYNEDL